MQRFTVHLVVGGIILFGTVMYLAGWHAAAAARPAPVAATPVQGFPQPKIFPLPLPNDRTPSPGQNAECKPIILFYYQGQLYELMPGLDDQPGAPTSPPEYFPLRPYQGPQIPGLPFAPSPQPGPHLPGFKPVQPRF